MAGTIQNTGYIAIKIDGKLYLAHRLAYLYHAGYFPELELDHINNIKTDNRLVNLREVTHWENQQNRIDTKRNNGVMWKDRMNEVRREHYARGNGYYHRMTDEQKREYNRKCEERRRAKTNIENRRESKKIKEV